MKKLLIFFTLFLSIGAYLDVILDYCDILEQERKFLDFSELKVKKINKTTRALSGTARIVQPLDNDILFEGLMYRKMGGAYGLLPFKIFLRPFCVNMNADEAFWPDVVKGLKLPGCPIPANNYTGDITFTLEKFPKSAIPSVNAYWDNILDHSEVLSQNVEFMDWSELRIRKVNKTARALTGNTKVYKQLDDNTLFEGLVYRKMGGTYKLLPFQLFKKPFCQSMREEEYFWPEAMEGFKLPGCPVPVGNYTGDAIFKAEKIPKNILPSGDYAFELIFTRGLNLVLKFRIYATVVQV